MAEQPHLYIICGCNGAGKTTASFVVLPELLDCYEFLNADEIAKGISPFHPEGVAISAGKIMLERIQYLIASGKDFGFETTLSSKGIEEIIDKARKSNFRINLIYFWLDSVELAFDRVTQRVKEGGHSIPKRTIQRRYYRGIENFLNVYHSKADMWLLLDNSNTSFELIASSVDGELTIHRPVLFQLFKSKVNGDSFAK